MRWTDWVEDTFKRIAAAEEPRALMRQQLVPELLRHDDAAVEAGAQAMQTLLDSGLIGGTGTGIGLTERGQMAASSSVGEALRDRITNACEGIGPDAERIVADVAVHSERPGQRYATYIPVNPDRFQGMSDAETPLWGLQQRGLLRYGSGNAISLSLVGFYCARRHEEEALQARHEVLEAGRRAYNIRPFSVNEIRAEASRLVMRGDNEETLETDID